MNVYRIILKNQLFSCKDIDSTIVENFIKEEQMKGEKRKYPFNFFYEFSAQNIYSNKTIKEIYEYSIKNFTIFFNSLEEKYTQEEINMFALLFTLKNYKFNIKNYKNGLEFIETNYIELKNNSEIVKWCIEEIKIFKLFLYSLDVENYKNGNIQNMLNELEEIIPVHKDTLIYEVEENYDEY